MNKASGYDIHCHVVINMSTIQNIHVFSKLEKSLSQLRVITSSKKAVTYDEVAACEVFQDLWHRYAIPMPELELEWESDFFFFFFLSLWN